MRRDPATNPILWGRQNGYSDQQIADGLQISLSRVRADLLRAGSAVAEHLPQAARPRTVIRLVRRDRASVILGDPPAGRSALDQKQESRHG